MKSPIKQVLIKVLMDCSRPAHLACLLYVFLATFSIAYPQLALAQEKPTTKLEEELKQSGPAEKIQAPVKVDVKPQARDEEISERLKSILEATGWFIDPTVHVKDGVVFLEGKTKSDEYKKWAGELARNTQDAAAVVNQVEVMQPSIWDFKPVIEGLKELWRGFLRTIPAFIFGLLILAITWFSAKGAAFLARLFLRHRIKNSLIQRVIIWGISLGIFLIGLYSIFHLMGLTAIALTVIGGTGLLGIILGIAFKEITENLLASIFLSVNNPFNKEDLIEIDGITGYVQRLTVRSTILITLDGNYVQIPNATVYKSNIRNYTSNPNRREDFIIGIGYDCKIADAQEIALKVLKEHPAVLQDPEPWVLVDSLGKATVNLRIYFWLDGRKHSWLKVRSSVIRLVKRAFQTGHISMPDEAREVIFPQGITVWKASEKNGEEQKDRSSASIELQNNEVEIIATEGERGLQSEASDIREQGIRSQAPEQGRNLLKKGPSMPEK